MISSCLIYCAEPPIRCYQCVTKLDSTGVLAFNKAPNIACAALTDLKRVLDDKYMANEQCETDEVCAAHIGWRSDHCKY